MGIFLNICSKTNMAGHYAETSGNWDVSFWRLHKEQGTWEKGAHNEKADQMQLHKDDMGKKWSPAPDGSS